MNVEAAYASETFATLPTCTGYKDPSVGSASTMKKHKSVTSQDCRFLHYYISRHVATNITSLIDFY
jgi:hypothetical protein